MEQSRSLPYRPLILQSAWHVWLQLMSHSVSGVGGACHAYGFDSQSFRSHQDLETSGTQDKDHTAGPCLHACRTRKVSCVTSRTALGFERTLAAKGSECRSPLAGGHATHACAPCSRCYMILVRPCAVRHSMQWGDARGRTAQHAACMYTAHPCATHSTPLRSTHSWQKFWVVSRHLQGCQPETAIRPKLLACPSVSVPNDMGSPGTAPTLM